MKRFGNTTLIIVCIIAVTFLITVAIAGYVVLKLSGPPASPDKPAPSPNLVEATIRQKVDAALDGDAADFYAGVWAALATELGDAEGITNYGQLVDYVRRVAEASDRNEPVNVAVKPIWLDAFQQWDGESGDIGSEREKLVARCLLLEDACREGR